MKIKRIESQVVRLPADEPLAGGASFGGPSRDFVTLRIETDAGIEGIGLTFFGAGLTATLKHAVDQLGALALEEDPLRGEGVGRKLCDAAAGSGPGGIFTLALSAIDMALWDIKGKALGQPLAMLLGGFRDRVSTYASGALMRTFSLDHVVKAASLLLGKGYRQMKMQLALPGDMTPQREVERARLIREAVGPDVDLMCDINQRWDVRQAISIGSRVEEYHLFWLEDVVAHDDYPGLASVTAALATPIAAGEYVYGLAPFRHMLEAKSVDIVMIDVLRAGGITQWLKIAGMAEAYHLPVAPHDCTGPVLLTASVHLSMNCPNTLVQEIVRAFYYDWYGKLVTRLPPIRNGYIAAPEGPGLGTRLQPAVLKRKDLVRRVSRG